VKYLVAEVYKCLFTTHTLHLLSIFFFSHGIRLSLLGTVATVWLLVPAPCDDDDCGPIGGMQIGNGKQSTRRKPAPVPLFPRQIPLDLIWAETQAATVGSQRLTTWAMAQSYSVVTEHCKGDYEAVLNSSMDSGTCPVKSLSLDTRNLEPTVTITTHVTNLYRIVTTCVNWFNIQLCISPQNVSMGFICFPQ
jgi:hypothetical protein